MVSDPARLSRLQVAALGGLAAAALTAAALAAKRVRRRLEWRRRQAGAPILVRDMVVAKHPTPGTAAAH